MAPNRDARSVAPATHCSFVTCALNRECARLQLSSYLPASTSANHSSALLCEAGPSRTVRPEAPRPASSIFSFSLASLLNSCALLNDYARGLGQVSARGP